ncbi:hypothetical protein J6I90_12235 [Pseudidiomarina sp. 1APP75-32.1]|uniref:Potassium channel domain-containing protein n=1 Tax=Pseudidiomarina terrestris TaxID=2820060 RepID=A0AAW7R1L9_9GAMM|nr:MULTISPECIES: ion channel [unclassified Pseudidiomarina]MDN7125652.1 hypothetical protein [Pseudidiomarina sp. 1APP75-32.1]MDN7130484.1 hypothetical protein [Pseudidiomarina sp. 1APR75-15]
MMLAGAHWIVAVATLVLVLLVILMHYEASFRLRRLLQRNRSLRRRARIMVLLIGLFFAHIGEVWLFGVGGWLLFNYADLAPSGGIGALANPDLFDFVFLSIASYTTVGFADAYPMGPLRFLYGTEGLLGFMMITWSASLSFLEMQHHWQNMEQDK